MIAKAKEDLADVRAALAKERLAWVNKIKDGPTHVATAVKAVANLLRVDATEVDRHPDKINTPAGLLNLRTLTVEAPRPEHYCTKITQVSYKKGAVHADVESIFDWLEESVEGYRESLTRYIGMGMTAYHAKCFMMVDGPQNAAKSTAFETAVRVLGDDSTDGYARIVPPKVWTVNNADTGQSPSPVLHELRGIRFVFSDEANRVGFMNSELVKKLVAGGMIVTRILHSKSVSWPSQVTLVFAGNGTLPLAADDAGIQERLLTVKMTKQLSRERMDADLERRMHEKEQMEAFFAKIAEGAQRFLNDGANRAALRIPEAVEASIRQHLEDADPLAEFIAERVDLVTDGVDDYLPLTLSTWTRLYNVWAKDVATTLKSQRLKSLIESHGYPVRDSTRRFEEYYSKGKLVLGWKLRDATGGELHARDFVRRDEAMAAERFKEKTPLRLISVDKAA